MKFYSKMLLICQFLEVKNNKSMYNLQSKPVKWYSQISLRDTPHLKVFCLNNHVLDFVISYVHFDFVTYSVV